MDVQDRQVLYIKEPLNDPLSGWRAVQFKYFQEHRGGGQASKNLALTTTGDQTISYRVKSIARGGPPTRNHAGETVWESGKLNQKGAPPFSLKDRRGSRRSHRVAAGVRLSPVQSPRLAQLEYLSLSVGIAYAPLPNVVSRSWEPLLRPTSGGEIRTSASSSQAPNSEETPRSSVRVDGEAHIDGTPRSASKASSIDAAAPMKALGSADEEQQRKAAGDKNIEAPSRTAGMRFDQHLQDDSFSPIPVSFTPISVRKAAIPGTVRLSALIRKNDYGDPQLSQWRRQLNSFQLHGGEIGGSVVDEAAYNQYARRRAVAKGKPV